MSAPERKMKVYIVGGFRYQAKNLREEFIKELPWLEMVSTWELGGDGADAGPTWKQLNDCHLILINAQDYQMDETFTNEEATLIGVGMGISRHILVLYSPGELDLLVEGNGFFNMPWVGHCTFIELKESLTSVGQLLGFVPKDEEEEEEEKKS